MSEQTLVELADVVLADFEWDKRADGSRYWSRKDVLTDDWIADLCHDAHGDMFPDDWRYEFIHDALVSVSEGDNCTVDDCYENMHEAVDGSVDIYNGRLCDWLGSHAYRSGYVDEARESFGESNSTMQSLMQGQYMEREEVFRSVLHSLAERLADTEG